MTRFSAVRVVLALVAASAGCGVSDGNGGGTNPPGGTPITPPDDGRICDAHFTISGSFTPGSAPRPTDPDTGMPSTACWPVGQWSFTAAMSDNTCATAPTVLSGYSFTVDVQAAPDGSGDQQVMTNTSSIGGMKVHLGMSLNGQGCEGTLELGSADGKDYWNMKPTLTKDPADRVLAGTGDYAEFKTDAWPWKDTSQ